MVNRRKNNVMLHVEYVLQISNFLFSAHTDFKLVVVEKVGGAKFIEKVKKVLV